MDLLEPSLRLFASVIAGVSVGAAAWVAHRIMVGRRPAQEEFEEARREKLRRSNGTYRRFEPLIEELKRIYEKDASTESFAHHLRLLPATPPWQPAEFMAARSIEAVGVALAITAFIAVLGYPFVGFMVGAVTGLMYPSLSRGSIVNRSKARLKRIKRRIPFAIDQVSLMMEAGAGFEDSLKTVVADNREHPVSQELAEVVRQMSLGRPRSQALSGFRDRLSDDDISEIVFAIIKGEELGTPLSSILREQANQMRLKRSQWGEKAASEAEVQMVFPGMITMVACLLVIVAPVLLPVVTKLLES